MGPDFVNSGESIRASWANSLVSELRKRKRIPKRGVVSRGGGSSTPCPFGRLSGGKITGGLVFAGDKNFTVEDYEVNLETDKTVLLYFSISVTANKDDDGEIFLPNVETASWTPAWDEETGDSYDDNTAPTLPTGEGTIIIPLGKLTVEDGGATFAPTGCGNITINHCAGTLSYSRA